MEKMCEDRVCRQCLILLIVVLLALLMGCVENGTPPPTPTSSLQVAPPVHGYTIVNVYPHDQTAFTEGLFFDKGVLYESTGIKGKSELRKVKFETGKVLQVYQLPAQFFGEGLVLWNNSLIQLTWQSKSGFVYDKESFLLQREFAYPTEGWGLTHDETHLIMSDGTATLYFLNPETFKEVRRLEVHDRGVPVTRLNELEYIKGMIYANVWPTNRIAIISPQSGQVVGWIDLQGLLSEED